MPEGTIPQDSDTIYERPIDALERRYTGPIPHEDLQAARAGGQENLNRIRAGASIRGHQNQGQAWRVAMRRACARTDENAATAIKQCAEGRARWCAYYKTLRDHWRNQGLLPVTKRNEQREAA